MNGRLIAEAFARRRTDVRGLSRNGRHTPAAAVACAYGGGGARPGSTAASRQRGGKGCPTRPLEDFLWRLGGSWQDLRNAGSRAGDARIGDRYRRRLRRAPRARGNRKAS